MKKIGFIDYYLSEWHANNYPDFIKKLNSDYEVAYAWAEKDVSEKDGVTTDEWCEKYGVTKCNDIAELCSKSDAVMILSPDNPEKHLSYAKEAFKFGKPVYVDKTFAPDFETAKEIFKLAKENGARFFSSSALRYATELEDFGGCTDFTVIGGGKAFSDYVVHLAEMIRVITDKPVKAVKTECQGIGRICRIMYNDGSFATLIHAPGSPYQVSSMGPEKKSVYRRVESDFFMILISKILQFFDTGIPPFDISQTLDVMAICDALLRGEKAENEYIYLN